jgi:bile acid-coenzyme A ligase
MNDVAQGTSLAAKLKQLAQEAPDAPAITSSNATLTRRELDLRAEALARDLKGRGVGVGDYLSIVLPNTLEHPIATVAAWKIGAVPQPLSPKLARQELAEIIELTKPAMVIGITDASVVGSTPAQPGDYIWSPLPADEEPLSDAISPSWKAPTSGGSTGRPKVIRAGQPGIFERVSGFTALLRLHPGSASLITAPLSHNGPFMATMLTLLVGGHAIVMPRFDAEALLKLVSRHRVTWVFAVPTMMIRIWKLPAKVRERYDISSIETWAHMAAPCPPEIKEAWINWLGPETILEAYAGTEAQAITLIDGKQWLSHRGSVGRPVVGEIQIRDDDGRPLSAGQIGRVWMRRPSGAPPTYEYLGAEPLADDDGWETLGDMGWFDAEGYLYLADRDSDMMLVGGSNVYPAEVEAAILEYPPVLDVCVIGLPNDDLGSAPHAIVQADGDLDLDELANFVGQRLAPYKRPRSYEVVSEPFRDEAGKLRRGDLVAARR